MEDIRIYNTDFKLLHIDNNVISSNWTVYFNSVGTFEIHTLADTRTAEIILDNMDWEKNKIPVIVGESGMCAAGGLATYGINYYELGKQTAKMAVEILKDGKNPADMPIQYLEKCDLSVNEETAKALGITIPENL